MLVPILFLLALGMQSGDDCRVQRAPPGNDLAPESDGPIIRGKPPAQDGKAQRGVAPAAGSTMQGTEAESLDGPVERAAKPAGVWKFDCKEQKQ